MYQQQFQQPQFQQPQFPQQNFGGYGYNPYGNYGYPSPYGYNMPTYNMNAEVPKMAQWLTPEEAKALQNTSEPFNLALTRSQALAAKCTHKTLDGRNLAIEHVGPEANHFRCTICGTEFNLIDPDDAGNEAALERVHDMIESQKFMGINSPESMYEFNIISPLLKSKLMPLFKMNKKQFDKIVSNIETAKQGQNAFAMMEAVSGIPYPMYPGYNPGFGPQPQMPNYPTAPTQPGFNPAMPYGPATAAAGYNPFGSMPNQQPVAPMQQQPQQQVSISNDQYAEYMKLKNASTTPATSVPTGAPVAKTSSAGVISADI